MCTEPGHAGSCTGRMWELGVHWPLHIYKGSAAKMEPHIKFLTAIGSGYGPMCLSWCRTVEGKTDHEAMLALQRVYEQEPGYLLPLPPVSPTSSLPRQDSSVSPGKVTKLSQTGSW